MAGGVWAAGKVQQNADTRATRSIDAAQRMLIAMLDQETGLRGFINTHDEKFLEPYNRGALSFDRAVASARDEADDPGDRRLVEAQFTVARRWQRLAALELDKVRERRGPSSVADARVRKQSMDLFRDANANLTAQLEDDRADQQSVARRTAVLLILALGLVFFALGWWAVERPLRTESRRRLRLSEFSDALQIARSETEAFDVLRRHVERWLKSARAVVLMRNASANRLQAATPTDAVPILAAQLEGAAPEACLAVRLAKPYVREPGDRALVECELCGKTPGPSACVPSVVGGEVVGSVLVQMPAQLGQTELEDLQASVASASPVIANLRNLAIAELRAATDVLTGLPNHRAIQDTLNRMVAQAGRTKGQLAAVLFDLDHFKEVNDIHGHARGDAVLAAVGAAVRHTLRDSDFAGRYGGEEFVMLLPDTDKEGALVVAEKLRQVIEIMRVEDFPENVSASFGVAVLPGDAVNGEQLLRSADRALYLAKNAGRNRVESLS